MTRPQPQLTPQEGALLIGFRQMDDRTRSVIVHFCREQGEKEKARIKAEGKGQKGTLRLVTVDGRRTK